MQITRRLKDGRVVMLDLGSTDAEVAYRKEWDEPTERRLARGAKWPDPRERDEARRKRLFRSTLRRPPTKEDK